MKWSFKIARIAGIDIFVHATFFLLLAWFGLGYYLMGKTGGEVIEGIGFILILFGIVVLHELGHALTAKYFGIRTRDITLLPIGGLARIERLPEKPIQELWIALAGPAVNIVLGLFLLGLLFPTLSRESLQHFDFETVPFLVRLMGINFALAFFNLLPAFPMDGGRVLRALLALKMDYVRATETAARIGQGMALLFGFLGLFGNPFLLLIALFVWTGASQEASATQIKAGLWGVPVKAVMMTEFQTLSPQERLSHAIDHVLSGYQIDFPVVENGTVKGILTRSQLLKSLAHHGPQAPVVEVMQQDFETASPSEMAETVLSRLQERECQAVPVLQNHQLVGLLTPENIGEFLMIRSAMKKNQPPPLSPSSPPSPPRKRSDKSDSIPSSFSQLNSNRS